MKTKDRAETLNHEVHKPLVRFIYYPFKTRNELQIESVICSEKVRVLCAHKYSKLSQRHILHRARAVPEGYAVS